MGKQRNEDRQHGAGNGGVVPPVDRRWKPGQSGNPAGRPKNAGATKKEWLNTFAAQGLTEDELRRMERDPKAPQPKRAAAQQMLHARMPQMADYENLVNGTKTVTELAAEGIDTSLIKKLKVRQELDREGNVTAVTREPRRRGVRPHLRPHRRQADPGSGRAIHTGHANHRHLHHANGADRAERREVAGDHAMSDVAPTPPSPPRPTYARWRAAPPAARSASCLPSPRNGASAG